MKPTKNILTFLILFAFLWSCGSSNKAVSFKNNSGETGIYESDSDGKSHVVLGDNAKNYNLKSTPTIPVKEFETLEIGDECYSGEVCVDFQLTEKGTIEYTELTERNLEKQIFYVIDGVIIADPMVMGVINSGMGQFPIKKKFFDSLFVIK